MGDKVSDGLLEFFLFPSSAPLFDRDLDRLSDDKRLGVASIGGDESSVALELALAVEEFPVEAASFLCPGARSSASHS